MSSRLFFYVLPDAKESLDFEALAIGLSRQGLAFHSPVFINSIDECGVIVSSRERPLPKVFERHLQELLGEGRQVELVCGDGNVVMTCTFGSPHSPPICSLNMSKKLWMGMRNELRARYEVVLATAAEQAGAGGILIVADAADDFLGHIEPIDGQWLVDMRLPDGTEYEPTRVWLKRSNAGLIVMRPLIPTGRAIGAFDEFVETTVQS